MPNQSGRAYGLSTLCPLKPSSGEDASPGALVRDFLNDLPIHDKSPMARVPNTYFARFFVLDDVVYQGAPNQFEHLKSKYLVYIGDFHGELEPYLEGMWQHAEAFVRRAWKYCVGFEAVKDPLSFARYIQRCQVQTTFYFNGSNDEPLAEQLKALYLKQEFSKFAFKNQGLPAVELQAAFKAFVEQVRPFEDFPRWAPGAARLENAVVRGS
jgi:hypothetical protein